MQPEKLHGVACSIIHYTPNSDRKAYLVKALPETWEVNWITKYDRDDLGELSDWVSTDSSLGVFPGDVRQLEVLLQAHSIGLLVDRLPWSVCFGLASLLAPLRRSLSRLNPRFGYQFAKVTLGEVSVILKHLDAWSTFIESDHDLLLVLEDDAVFPLGASTKVQDLFAGLRGSKKADCALYIDVAGGCGLRPRRGDRVTFPGGMRKVVPSRTRTAAGYVLTRPAARSLLSRFPRPLNQRTGGIDWLVALILQAEEIEAWWAEPTLLIHGSEHGAYSPWQRPE